MIKRYVIKGKSMEPRLHDGQKCLIIEGKYDDLLGEIVCISRYGQKIIHRIIVDTTFCRWRIIVEKGDNYCLASLVNPDDIVGKYVGNKKQVSSCNYSIMRIVLIFVVCRMFKLVSHFLHIVRKRTFFKVEYMYLYVIPTIVLRNDSFFKCVRELKKTFRMYKKNQRFKCLCDLYINNKIV